MRRSLIFLALLVLGIPASASEFAASAETLRLPWHAAGLSEAEAAAHLLDRLAYGARPGDVERLTAMGIEAWVAGQLDGDLADPRIESILAGFATLRLSSRETSERFPSVGRLLREAEIEGIVKPEDFRDGELDPAARARVLDYARKQGYQPTRRLLGELMAQKLIRAVHSENQLVEVLTDFWFNHFNVSLDDDDARVHLPAYERDAIRPHVLGSFRAMLGAVAKHPAMLLYLDNARSVAGEDAPKAFDRDQFLAQRLAERLAERRAARGGPGGRGGAPRGPLGGGKRPAEEANPNRPSGLNENFARELLELHTLGVDGGYTQADVGETARAFTGWSTYPPVLRPEIERRIAQARRLPAEAGFVFEESFLFRADAHDAGEKRILGRTFPAGRGLEDGLEVLDLVAAHPSTARHLATKLAIRFVSDEPPPALIARLESTFSGSGGDLRRMMKALLESPEFWAPAARRAKIKSPFELAVSAVRAIGAEITDPRDLIAWIGRMGQPLYAYQAPTGYPDRADAWVNTGSVLNRMNFGLHLATGGISGVRFDLPALNGGLEPESLDQALRTYAAILLPERDTESVVTQLESVVRAPELSQRLDLAAPPRKMSSTDWEDALLPDDQGPSRRRGRREQAEAGPLAQVVGVILGSPEFQRR